MTEAFLLEFIATSNPFNPVLDPIPQQYDNHIYQTPGWFAENSFYYDSFEVHMRYIVSHSTWKLTRKKAQWHSLLRG